MLDFLREHGIEEKLIQDVIHFRNYYKVNESVKGRIPKLKNLFYGKEIWSMCIVAILEDENILLCGPKATGKNLLADNI